MEEIEFNEHNVDIQVEADNWEDAIRKGIRLLEKNGCVTTNYVESVIQNVKEYGPYIVIYPGLAIPHARPENGVIQIGYSLITLKKPVYFPDSNIPVSVLISFSATDGNTHLELIKMIVKIANSDLINQISTVCSVEALNQLLNKYIR
ncbi:MAG: PTS sugar transporter [Caldibacillus debilis]|uniref:PTS sugar transporter subunit IIA n=1 Tax=Caldibacillus debilis TaxID=301148 RepID=UPI000E37E836|nr:PTS sugar transporter subunit IIA [Caldibacillus debilis]REJ14982.1 MAG: PTS sugar transporter [Caldibacillus debilis]